MQQTLDFTAPKFSGAVYDEQKDGQRLKHQINVIFDLMKDCKFRTLREIEDLTDFPQSSISAQLRNLKKPAFGSHALNKRRRDGRGTWEYQIIPKL